MKIYAVEGSSYDGCNGWNSWIMENTITTDYEKVCKMAEEKKSTYVRTNVIVVGED